MIFFSLSAKRKSEVADVPYKSHEEVTANSEESSSTRHVNFWMKMNVRIGTVSPISSLIPFSYYGISTGSMLDSIHSLRFFFSDLFCFPIWIYLQILSNTLNAIYWQSKPLLLLHFCFHVRTNGLLSHPVHCSRINAAIFLYEQRCSQVVRALRKNCPVGVLVLPSSLVSQFFAIEKREKARGLPGFSL